MDIFCEYMVKRKKQKADIVLEAITILVAIYLSSFLYLPILLSKNLTTLFET